MDVGGHDGPRHGIDGAVRATCRGYAPRPTGRGGRRARDLRPTATPVHAAADGEPADVAPARHVRIGVRMSAGMPLVELRHVSRAFGGSGMFSRQRVVALKDFSLAVDADEPRITAVVGESGSGKTTM